MWADRQGSEGVRALGRHFELISLLVSLMIFYSQVGATERTCSADWTFATKPGHMKCEPSTAWPRSGTYISHSLAVQQPSNGHIHDESIA